MSQSVLIIVSINSQFAGGSIKSAASITKAFYDIGCSAYLIADSSLPFLTEVDFKIIHDEYTDEKIVGYFRRGRKILDILKRFKIDLIICMDKVSCYHASFPAALCDVPIIPIIPGGNEDAVKMPPLKLRKTVVFSEEMKQILIRKFSFSEASLLVMSNRFSFNSEFRTQVKPVLETIRIAYISRLHSSKFSAFEYFIECLNDCSAVSLEVHIIGDGKDASMFSEHTKKSKSKIEFLFIGFKTIDFPLLNQYNLVVTMGRGVIESIGMKVPVAICGEQGYKGLVTTSNIFQFGITNFTGRSLNAFSSLSSDLSILNKIDIEDLDLLANSVREKYDVKNMPNQILRLVDSENLIPGNGSFFRTLILNFRMLLKI